MNYDPLTGQKVHIKQPKVQRIQLVEDGIEPTFNFQDAGEVPGLFNEIGDGGSFEAVLFDESGEQVGTSFSEFEFIKQLGNGDFITELVNVLDFGDGNTITIEGTFNVNKFEDLKPARLDVVAGEGIYEDVKGKATLAQQELGVLDVVEIDLLLI